MSQQHTSTTTKTTIVTNQPTSMSTIIINHERDWSTGLCDCCEDMGSCLCAFFCPCFLECMIASDAKEFPLVPACVPGGSIALRTKLRVANGIKGSICDDCIKLTFCPWCGLAQMKREQMNIQAGRVQLN